MSAGSGSVPDVVRGPEVVGGTAPMPPGEPVGEAPGDVAVGVGEVAPGEGVPAPVGEDVPDWLLGVAAGPEGSSSPPDRTANVPASTRQVPAPASSTQLRRAPAAAGAAE